MAERGGRPACGPGTGSCRLCTGTRYPQRQPQPMRHSAALLMAARTPLARGACQWRQAQRPPAELSAPRFPDLHERTVSIFLFFTRIVPPARSAGPLPQPRSPRQEAADGDRKHLANFVFFSGLFCICPTRSQCNTMQHPMPKRQQKAVGACVVRWLLNEVAAQRSSAGPYTHDGVVVTAHNSVRCSGGSWRHTSAAATKGLTPSVMSAPIVLLLACLPHLPPERAIAGLLGSLCWRVSKGPGSRAEHRCAGRGPAANQSRRQ